VTIPVNSINHLRTFTNLGGSNNKHKYYCGIRNKLYYDLILDIIMYKNLRIFQF
jgi:hypothetical protein